MECVDTRVCGKHILSVWRSGSEGLEGVTWMLSDKVWKRRGECGVCEKLGVSVWEKRG